MRLIQILSVLAAAFLGCSISNAANGFAVLSNITEFDDVRFVYERSFHDKIEVVVTREKRSDGVNLRVITWPMDKKSGKYLSPTLAELSVSETAFIKLCAQLSRGVMLSKSLEKQTESLDGSDWLIELRKGGLRIGQSRHSPNTEHDTEFRMIGLQILSLAKIEIPKEALY